MDAAGRSTARDGAPPPRRPPGGQLRRLVLAGMRSVVPRARDFARQALLDWGWLPATDEEGRAVAEDVLLVVSELVTNACLHAGGPDELRLYESDGVLRIEVTDGDPHQPEPRTPHLSGRPGGHGLHIVRRLSRRWGVAEVDGGGKTVWADIAPPPA